MATSPACVAHSPTATRRSRAPNERVWKLRRPFWTWRRWSSRSRWTPLSRTSTPRSPAWAVRSADDAPAKVSGLPGDVVRGEGGGEVALVDPRVVVAAEQREVEQGCRPAVDPVFDVVRVGPLRWPSAAGVGAAFVPGPQRGEQGWGDQAFGAAHVQGLAFGTQDHRDDVGVAGELAEALG